MITKIAAILALLLAASGYALYHQIQSSGELRAELEQQAAETAEANRQVAAVEAENKRQNDLIVRVTNERDEAEKKSGRVRTIVRTVVAASTEPCVTAPVPADVARAAQSAINELWGAADASGKSRDAITSGSADAGLRTP